MKILSMSSFVPEHICDTIRFTQYHGDRNISHYCGYASDFISEVINDDDIDGAVYPRSCDSSRGISSYLENTGKFLYQMHVPMGEDLEFYAFSIQRYKEAVEAHYGISINNIKDRTILLNKRNSQIRKLYEQVGEISFADYLEGIHKMLRTPLEEQQVEDGLAKAKGGKPIFLVGSFLSNIDIVRKIENSGLRVVGDTLTESGRLASMKETEVDGDIYCNIAKSIYSGKLSPSQNNFKKIIESDMDEIHRKEAAGVLFVTQKYCEPYDYLISLYESHLDALGIPSTRITLTDTEDTRKVDLILEAFEGMI